MEFEKRVLANGLTVLFEKRDVDVTSVMLGVKYGSAYDSIEEKGMAHFIEHLCFKGTKKRTAKQIVDEVEKIGGEVNAFTHEEITAYYVKLSSEHLDVAMDVIFDIFFSPVFPEGDVGREASVICEEIKMVRDNPMRHALEKIKENLYEEPFGFFGGGRAEVVRRMTRNQLKGRHDEVYLPENSVLCVVGNNDFSEIISLAEKLTLGVRSQRSEVGAARHTPNTLSSGASQKLEVPEIVGKIVKNDEKRAGLEQANVVLGFHFPMASDKERYAAEVFSAILGQGMSSKLFAEVREKRGLVYGVKTDLDMGKNYGYMVIWAGTDPVKVEEVKSICLEEFGKMGEITEAELEEAKAQVVGNWKVESEGSSETAVNLIMEEIAGDAREYYDYEDRIGEVTLEDIKKLAGKTEFASFSLGP
ncbi:insulinase family protein [Candidatus Pacearchaeota archaeon]|nr:insulinase family protein [Candidatus Pacearchaeota archaeon]